MHCNNSWSFKHALNIIPSKNLTYFNQTSIIQHEASILKEFYAMTPDVFRTELHDSFATFYENILKKAGAGGRPVAKPLIRKFVSKTTTMPEAAPSSDADADANAVEPLPPTLHRRWPLRRNPQRKPQLRPPKTRRRRSKGRPCCQGQDQGLIETCLSLHCCH